MNRYRSDEDFERLDLTADAPAFDRFRRPRTKTMVIPDEYVHVFVKSRYTSPPKDVAGRTISRRGSYR